MGIALAALAILAAVAAAGLATSILERHLVGTSGESGVARPVRIAIERQPYHRDRWLYGAAPLVALFGVTAAMVVIPFGEGLVAADLGIGLFYYLVAIDFVVLAIALGGWGTNTRGAIEACYRAVAQLVAYLIPLGLAVLGPVMMARSLSTVRIVEAQRAADLWYVVPQPLGFALYLATAAMQAFRAPFLEPFAQDIDQGVLATYGGWRAAVWRLALSALAFVVAAMGAVLFLGGPAGPYLPGPVWMLIKSFAVLALLLGLGRKARRRNTAAMLQLAWRALIPLGLVNVLVVGAEILVGIGQAPFTPMPDGHGHGWN